MKSSKKNLANMAKAIEGGNSLRELLEQRAADDTPQKQEEGRRGLALLAQLEAEDGASKGGDLGRRERAQVRHALHRQLLGLPAEVATGETLAEKGPKLVMAPKVPTKKQIEKAAKSREEREQAGPSVRSQELAAIKARLQAKMPALDPALLGPGMTYSRDVRLIASSRVPRICSGCDKVVPAEQPLFQWTSNQPGNENGYMFRGECHPPTAEDLMNSTRTAGGARPRRSEGAAALPLAEMLALLTPTAELGAEPASLGSVKVSAATLDLLTQAMERAGIKSQADFRRMAYRHFANALLAAP